MLLFLVVVFAATSLWLLRLLWVIQRELRHLETACRERRISLLGHAFAGVRFVDLPALYKATNALITENQNLAEAQESSLGQIEATLRNLKEAVLIVDADGRVVSTNEALRVLLQSDEALIGRRLESVIQNSAFHQYVSQLRQGESEAPIEIELEIGPQTGFFEVAGARIDPALTSKNTLLLFVLHDITRTRKLERIRTEFVANVSHELRTPVTIMKGYAEMLIDDHADMPIPERLRFLEKIRNSAIRLHNLLEELLLLSRLEAKGEALLKRERFPLNQIIRELADDFARRLGEGQELHLDLQADPDELLLDELRISQVINNLMENVLKHARGFTQMTIRTRRREQAVECIVEDNGSGIDEADLGHIFERFYRGDKGRSRESGGTGLGLSIVKHIIQIHGGQVFADSCPESCTCLGFVIPDPEMVVEQAVFKVIRERE